MARGSTAVAACGLAWLIGCTVAWAQDAADSPPLPEPPPATETTESAEPAAEGPTETVIDGATNVELVPHWQAGDVLRYKTRTQHERIEHGVVSVEWSADRDITIEVVEATDQGFRTNWTFGEATFRDRSGHVDLGIKLASRIMAGQPITIDLDARGTLQGIAQWEALREQLRAALDPAVEWLSASEDASEVAALKDQFESLLENQDAAQEVLLGSVKAFLTVYGETYTVGQPLEFERTTANPFGGDPFPIVEAIVMETYDPETGAAELVWRQRMAPERTVEILRHVLDALSKRDDVKPELMDRVRAMWLQDDAVFRVDTKTGTVLAMKHRQGMRESRNVWKASTALAFLQTP